VKLGNLIRRLFRRQPRGVGLFQFVSPAAEPYVRPSVEEQAAGGRAYMERYYGWMQGEGWPGRDSHGYDSGGVKLGPAMLAKDADASEEAAWMPRVDSESLPLARAGAVPESLGDADRTRAMLSRD
jgi:hypothetical protein